MHHMYFREAVETSNKISHFLASHHEVIGREGSFICLGAFAFASQETYNDGAKVFSLLFSPIH